jgi:TonB family protein
LILIERKGSPMARYTCWVCGSGYDGVNCPVCAINKKAEETARQASRDQERATAAMEAAVSEQTERLAEEMARSREAAEQAAIDTQMAMAEAAEQQRMALAQSAEEHKRIASNAWKLQAQAKSDQAYRLYRSGLFAEALHLAQQAIKEDPGNIDAVFVVGACLEYQGKSDEAHPYLIKQVQMLSMPEYRWQLKIHSQVLLAISSDPALIKVFSTIVHDNLSTWPPCDSIEGSDLFTKALIEKQQYELAILVQEWVLHSKGATPDALNSTRMTIYALINSPGGLDSSRSGVERIIQWLQSLKSSSYASHGKDGLVPLIALAYSMEFASILEIGRGSLNAYFEGLQFEQRGDFETELKNLEYVVSHSDLGRESLSSEQVFSLRKTLARIKDAARQKYSSWEQLLQTQIYDGVIIQVANLPKQNLGCLAGGIWLIVLFLVGLWPGVLLGRGASAIPFSFPLGVLSGAVLLGALSAHTIRSFRRYNLAHERLTATATRQNKDFEQLGLPQIPIPELRLRSPWFDLAVCAGVAIAFVVGWQFLILKGTRPTSIVNVDLRPYSGTGIEDDMAGRSAGNAYGIHWTTANGHPCASFRASDSSRIEYPASIPSEGTLEFWIKVDSGYEYSNYVFKSHQDHALVFSTDVPGGDETWPGTIKLTLFKNGDISLWMATSKYNRPPAIATVASATSFRFGQWHAVGISYGDQGQLIMLDGRVVATAPNKTQRLGGAGTDASPLDVPTIGETVSHAWQAHRYNGGFEGLAARFRASPKQQDWQVARGINGLDPAPSAVPSSDPQIGTQQALSSSSITEASGGKSDASPEPALVRPKVIEEEMAAHKISGALPAYPPIAKASRIQGTVLLDAVISDSGSITNLRVVSGPAMLQQSALDAVRTWHYKPYLANGVPTEVETDIEVIFKLP